MTELLTLKPDPGVIAAQTVVAGAKEGEEVCLLEVPYGHVHLPRVGAYGRLGNLIFFTIVKLCT